MERVDIIIRGCMIAPLNSKAIINHGVLAIRNGKIAFIGTSAEASAFAADRELDAKGKVALPGLVNCHSHIPMTLFRGLADDLPLGKWLKEYIWPLEARLKPDDIYSGSLLGCLEMIKGGVTCVADMYFREEVVARAVEQSGLRGALAEGIIGARKRKQETETFSAGLTFARCFEGRANGRITTMLGPHSAYSCSPELLSEVVETASKMGVGVHVHLGESGLMFRPLRKKYGCGEVEFLDKIGFFSGRVIAAHCVDLTKKDEQILSKRGVNVVYVPVSNMKLGLGTARIVDMLELGVNICLGTDGPASNNGLDMFETMKLATLFQKGAYGDPTVLPAYAVLKMATTAGAKALGLSKTLGSLEVGKKADVILVDLAKPHMQPLHDVFSTIVYSARASDVDTVIVDGKVLMEERQVKSLDEYRVMEKANDTAHDLASR